METTTTIHASNSDAQSAPLSKGRLWTGRIMSALPALFLLIDGVGKLVKPAPVVQGTLRLGYPESVLLGLGIVLLACIVLYVIPRTAILGAILLTGYLGGAIATHVRVGSPLFSHILFPVYLAVLLWGGSTCAMSGSAPSFRCGVSSRWALRRFVERGFGSQDVRNVTLRSS